MLAREIMSADPVCATPNDSVQKIARLMRDQHFGCVPVVRGDHDRFLVGLVTDRDLAVRVVSEAKPADTPIEDVMSTGLSCCLPDARVEDVEDIMTRRQVRRVPVVDSTGACVGIIALADIARAAVKTQAVQDSELGRLVEYVSTRSDAARSDADVGVYPHRLQFAAPQPVV